MMTDVAHRTANDGLDQFIAYYFLHTAARAADRGRSRRPHRGVATADLGVEIDFAVNGALGKLEGLGLLRREKERLFVSPLDGACAQLQAVWDKFLASEPKVPTK
jgi:hypothetical protein